VNLDRRLSFARLATRNLIETGPLSAEPPRNPKSAVPCAYVRESAEHLVKSTARMNLEARLSCVNSGSSPRTRICLTTTTILTAAHSVHRN
jgi:hypothetical protein